MMAATRASIATQLHNNKITGSYSRTCETSHEIAIYIAVWLPATCYIAHCTDSVSTCTDRLMINLPLFRFQEEHTQRSSVAVFEHPLDDVQLERGRQVPVVHNLLQLPLLAEQFPYLDAYGED